MPECLLPRVIETADGSKTLYCDHFRQTYHSQHGALTESQHIFMQASGFAERILHTSKISVLEVGFGTGLNYLLASKLAETAQTVLHYTALEMRFLPYHLLSQLEYGPLLGEELHTEALHLHLDKLQLERTDIPTFSHKTNRLKIFANVNSLFSSGTPMFDVVFLDAFSPEQNPELWSKGLIDEMYVRMNNHGTLATYSAKGDVRRALAAAGFAVRRLPGPPGKREILVAEKIQVVNYD